MCGERGIENEKLTFKALAHKIVEALRVQIWWSRLARLEILGVVEVQSEASLLEEFLIAQERSVFDLLMPSTY